MSLVDEHKHRSDGALRWEVESICRVLAEHGWQIAPATYHAAKTRPPSNRAVRDGQLKAQIARLHADNHGVYAKCTPRCAAPGWTSVATRWAD